jgi:pilus assembly protein CpaB
MNRRTRTFVVVLIAIVLASLASLGVYRAVQRIPAREVEIATTHAVVAARPLAMGTLLTKDDVKLVGWPARTPLAGGFTSVDQVTNRGVTTALEENEPLTDGKLAPAGSGGGLSPSIPQGMRAISVKVNEVIGVAGFVAPGTNVDVVVTVRAGSEGSMSRVVVSNVQVLTVGTRSDQQNASASANASAKDSQRPASSVVTLMVTPDDAERIALASAEGQIILTLRNPLDTLPTTTEGTRMASLMGSKSSPPLPVVRKTATSTRVQAPPPPPPEEPVKKIYEVEAIRAAKRTEEIVR